MVAFGSYGSAGRATRSCAGSWRALLWLALLLSASLVGAATPVATPTSAKPTPRPTPSPTPGPTPNPTARPSALPTAKPSPFPTAGPTPVAAPASAAVGYFVVQFYNSADCSDFDPAQSITKAYGNCEADPTGGSETLLLTLPLASSLQIVSSTTQKYSDSSCTVPIGNPITAPWSPPETNIEQVVLGTCYPVPSDWTDTQLLAMKLVSITSYLPTPQVRGVARATYSSASDCANKMNPQTIYDMQTELAMPTGCMPWPASNPIMPVSDPNMPESYQYSPDPSYNSVGLSCFSDNSCSSSMTCPDTSHVAIVPAEVMKLNVVHTCIPLTESPSSISTYQTSCFFDPQSSSCLPATGLAEVNSLAAPPAIKGYYKARYFSQSTTCYGPYTEIITPFGECEKNFDGRPNIKSAIKTYTLDSSGVFTLTVQYYSDTACQMTSGAPITQPMQIPGVSGTVQVGSCFNPDLTSKTVSYILDSVGSTLPTFVRSGLMLTSYQSSDNCQKKQGATQMFLQNGCYSVASSTGESYYVSAQCDGTQTTYSKFSDSDCLIPVDQMPATETKPTDSSCTFQGDDVGFSSTSDIGLYQQLSCYTPSAPSSSSSSSSGSDPTDPGVVAGGVVGGILGIAVVAAALWYCTSSINNKPMSSNEDSSYEPRLSNSQAEPDWARFQQQQQQQRMSQDGQRASIGFASRQPPGMLPPQAPQAPQRLSFTQQQQQQRLSFTQQQQQQSNVNPYDL